MPIPALLPYQVSHTARLKRILEAGQCAHDGSDTGVGKTYCAASVAADLGLETLVLAPLSVVPVWRRVLAGFGVEKATVINRELCWRRLGRVRPWGAGSFFEFNQVWPLTIFDECHRDSGDTSINSKMLIAAIRAGGKVLTLSATAASGVMKMKALGFALGLHDLKDYRLWLFACGVTETEVKLRNGRKFKKLHITKPREQQAIQSIYERIFSEAHGTAARMRIADIPGFPETQIEMRLCEDPPAEVMRLSAAMQDFYKNRNARAAMTPDEIAKIVFWRQASETAKIPVITDMIEDALETSKVAVFVNFNRTVDELLKVAAEKGWETGVIRGEQSPKERQATIERFQADRLDLVVCNIQAGGVGVSLHSMSAANRTAIICPSWSAVDLKQALGRVHRSGGGHSRQFLLYWNSGIEARVAKAVERKVRNLDLLNDGDTDMGGSDSEFQLERPAS